MPTEPEAAVKSIAVHMNFICTAMLFTAASGSGASGGRDGARSEETSSLFPTLYCHSVSILFTNFNQFHKPVVVAFNTHLSIRKVKLVKKLFRFLLKLYRKLTVSVDFGEKYICDLRVHSSTGAQRKHLFL